MRFLLFALVAACFAAPASGQKRVVGYYPAWVHSSYPHTAVRYDLLTHIAHAFIWMEADGSLLTQGYWTAYPALIEAAHASGVKVVIAVGGWSDTLTPNFAAMAASPVARAKFVSNLVAFVQAHGYDGVDLDWEYPRAGDRANVTALVRELRQGLAAANPAYTLSIAMPASNWAGGYDVRALQPHVDWFGIMTYDYHGAWTPHAGHNAPLYQPAGDAEGAVSLSVSAWRNEGVEASKLLVGIPFYGYRFAASGLHQPRAGAVSSVTYWAAEALRAAGWTYTWDSTARVPYLQNAARTELVTYEDTVSVQEKVAFVQARGLGGAMLWALHHDYDAATPGKGQPLLERVGTRLVQRASTATQAENPPADALRLFPPRPSPFSTETVIPFEVPVAGEVTLRVFNLLGAQVAVLARGAHPAGRHEAVWHATDLPAGLYLCRVEGPGGTAIQPVVLAR